MSARNLFPISFQRSEPGEEPSYHAHTSELFNESQTKSHKTSRSDRLRAWWPYSPDPELYVYKLFYFFFDAATALFAYLPLYYRESLLLDHHHVGLLMGVRPFCEFFGAPVLGTFADKFNKYKSTLYSGLLAYIIVYLSITFVNGVPRDCGLRGNLNITNNTRLNGSIDGGQGLATITKKTILDNEYREEVMQVSDLDPDTRSKRSSTFFDTNSYYEHERSEEVDADVNRVTSHMREQDGRRKRISNFGHNSGPSTSILGGNQNSRRLKTLNLRSSIKKSEIWPVNTNRKSLVSSPFQSKYYSSGSSKQWTEGNEDPRNETVYYQTVQNENLSSTSSETGNWWVNPPETAGENSWPIDVYRGQTKGHNSPQERRVRQQIFLILMLMTLAAELIGAPILTLADTATLQNLKKEPFRYGYQRVWASVGFGLMAVATGSVLHYTVSLKDEIKSCPEKLGHRYRPVFYSCGALLFLAFLTTFKFRFRVYEGKDTSGCGFYRGLKYFQNMEYLIFVFLAWVAGLANGLIDSFLFVHLIRLGATPLILVVTTTVQSVSKVIFFCLSPTLIVKYGYFGVIYAGLLTNVVTFFYYSFLESPWMVVPMELLSGISTSCTWAALVSYVGAPPKIGATLQGILHAVHIGLGRGIGGLFGGMILVNYGFDVLFRSFSLAVFLVVLVVYALRRYCVKQEIEPIWSKLWDYSPIAPYDELNDDD